MKKSVVALLAGIGMFALLVGGCANKEAVRVKEPDATTSTTKVNPVKAADNTYTADKGNVIKPADDDAAKNAALQNSRNAASKNIFETVYFDYDKADLRQDARNVLSKNAETILKSFTAAKIQVEGHCDERGSAEYNLALGEHRAKSAEKYLTTLGVRAENLSIISYGKEKPAVQGSDEAAWAKNRRAEFVVIK